MPGTVHIAMASDAEFSVPLCLAMHSIVAHATPGTHYRFHLLNSGIKRRLLDKGGFDYICYDVREKLKHLPCGGRFPYAVYHRFLLPDLLPADLDRVLYLDCDIMALEDLTDLYHAPLEDAVLGAVPWVVLGCYQEEFGKVLRSFPARNGLVDDGSPYFYSSMLLMDLKRMREEGIAAKLLQYAAEAPQGALLWPDQDVLNAVLRHRMAPLPLRYNVIPLFLPHLESETEEAKEAYRAPAIVHFAARKPNILTGPKDALEEAFFRMWKASPWHRSIPYPLVSLHGMPRPMASLLRLPMHIAIRHPRLLRAYGKFLALFRKKQA